MNEKDKNIILQKSIIIKKLTINRNIAQFIEICIIELFIKIKIYLKSVFIVEDKIKNNKEIKAKIDNKMVK